MGTAGRRLDQRFLDHPDRPVDQVLRRHFRQAVLANRRGAGEPAFEADFPPGSDTAGEIRRGPKAAERMEFELFTRLGDFVEGERCGRYQQGVSMNSIPAALYFG